MRSATSYFDLTLYKKDLTRFWPLWVLYTVVWLFILPFSLINEYVNRYGTSDIASRLERWVNRTPVRIVGSEAGVILALFVGVLGAMAVWSYLYNSRSANMMHSLPVRREGHFLTHYLAGVTMFTVPHLFIFVVTALTELACGATNLGVLAQAMGYMTLMCLFYFSFGTLCAMLTGHILMLPVFYGIFNLLVAGLAVLVDWLGTFFLYGYDGGLTEQEVVEWCTPVWAMMDQFHYSYPNVEVVLKDGSVAVETMTNTPYFSGGYVLWIYAAVGLVLAALALLLYRKRHLETAGDVVAVLWLRPVFLFGVAFCAGLAGSCFTCEIFGLRNLPFLIFGLLLWGVIGYFAALMLLNKSFKVFRKGWKGCLATAAAFLVLCGVMQFDLFGVESRVPNADNVAWVTVRGVNTLPGDSGNYLSSYGMEDPEFIAKVIAVHQAIVDDRAAGEELDRTYNYGYGVESYTQLMDGLGKSTSFTVIYTLKNGRTLERQYSYLWLDCYALQDPTSLESRMTELINDRSALFYRYDFDLLAESKLSAASIEDDHIRVRTALYTNPDDVYFTVPYYWDEYELTAEEAEAKGYYYEDIYPTSVAVEGYEVEGELIEVQITEAQAEKLRQAVLNDFNAGRLGVRYLFSGDPELAEHTCMGELNLYYEYEYTELYGTEERTYTTINETSIALTPEAVETIAVLTEMGAFDEGGAELRTAAGTVIIP